MPSIKCFLCGQYDTRGVKLPQCKGPLCRNCAQTYHGFNGVIGPDTYSKVLADIPTDVLEAELKKRHNI